MTPLEFKRLLRHGLGRAVLYGQTRRLLPYRQELWAACVENPAFDPQMEGERSAFLFDLIMCSGDVEWFRRTSVDLLAGPDDPDAQIYEIVRRFAAQGDEEARQVLYYAFTRNQPGSALNGESIIRLDGAAGYRRVIDVIGGTADLVHEAWIRHQLHNDAVAELGQSEALKVLHGAAAEGRQGQGFLDAVVWETPRSLKQLGQDLIGRSFDQLAPDVGRIGFAAMRRWARQASDADIADAAATLAGEADPTRLLALLGVFVIRASPGDLEPLRRLSDHDDYRIASRALRAIAQIQRDDARAFALESIRCGNTRKGTIETLMRNYCPGDEALVLQAICTMQIDDDIHSAQFETIEFLKAHPNPELEIEACIWFYDRNPCDGICREEQVERLLVYEAVPDWMVAECQWDANHRVRDMIRASHPA